MEKWFRADRGIRYREHPTRQHGKKRDRYYVIRYRPEKGKPKQEALGWGSKGWTLKKARARLSELEESRRLGDGPRTLEEKRQAEEARRKAKEEARQEKERAARTFADYAEKVYFPWADENKRRNTLRSEKMLFRLWLNPAIGSIPMVRVAEIHLERLKRNMAGKGRAPKTINLALALVRQIFNHAKKRQDYAGDNPVSRIKKPLVDNAKLRYLTAEEIETLLSALKEKSETVHDQALLAVNTGLRFSEIAGLQWEDVNYETWTLAIRDGKTGSRTVFFNDTIKKVLKARQGKKKTGLVFPIETGDKKGQRQEAVSKTFQREADRLFNKGVNDRRLRVSFHTLRHTFGSHVYGNTGDLYLTQKALGHKTMVMAQRYAKMNETRLREAFATMTNVLDQGKKAVREKKAKAGAGQVVNIRK